MYARAPQTLVSRVSVACLSTTNRVRLELVYGPMPDELFEQHQYHPAVKRLYRRKSHGMFAAAPVAKQQKKNVQTIPACFRAFDSCTLRADPVELGKNDFPTILPAVLCKDGPGCKQIVYPVRVLTNDTVRDDKTYTKVHVPRGLAEGNWWSYEMVITVACYCYN